MNKVVVCVRGPAPSGERFNEGTRLSPMLAAQHSRHAGSDFPSLDLGTDSFAGVSGAAAVLRTGHRTALKFLRAVSVARHLIPGLRRALQACKQSSSGISQGFQVSILSAGPAGLAGCFDRHEATKEKFPHDGKTGTRSGNLAARKGNAY